MSDFAPDAGHFILLLFALALAAMLFLQHSRIALLSQRHAMDVADLQEDTARLSAERDEARQLHRASEDAAHRSQLALAELKARAEGDGDRFAALAQNVLAQANQQFLQLAQKTFEEQKTGAKGDLTELIQPIKDNLASFATKVEAIEKVRAEDKSALQEQVKAIGESLSHNTRETSRLVTALTAPKNAGRWGELTLRNVLEQAGLSAHCDFSEQVTDVTEEGRQRPDAIIHLPGGREIVIDAKVSLDAYMAASGAAPGERDAHLKAHAASVLRHITSLGTKEYQSNLGDRFDFIVMFIPGENFFAAALEQAPDLIDKGLRKRVILATPATLVALARTVAMSWREHEMNAHAMEAAGLAAQLYERVSVLIGHAEKLGKSLDGSVGAYNNLMNSLEKRVLPAMRKFEDLSIAPPDKTMAGIKKIETRPQKTVANAPAPLLAFDEEAG
jgi:DNA recombination protein RmuC